MLTWNLWRLWILLFPGGLLLLAQLLKLSLQLVDSRLVVRPNLPDLVQCLLCLRSELFVVYSPLPLVGNESINILVESKNPVCELLLYVRSVLDICLYVPLIGLYSVYKLLYLLIPPGHELRLGVNRIAKILDLPINGEQPFLDCASIGLNQGEGGVYLVEEILIVLLVYGVDYLFL